jgi:hypothetical protein
MEELKLENFETHVPEVIVKSYVNYKYRITIDEYESGKFYMFYNNHDGDELLSFSNENIPEFVYSMEEAIFNVNKFINDNMSNINANYYSYLINKE